MLVKQRRGARLPLLQHLTTPASQLTYSVFYSILHLHKVLVF